MFEREPSESAHEISQLRPPFECAEYTGLVAHAHPAEHPGRELPLSSTLTQVIERAHAHLSGLATWARFELAVTSDNRECDPTDPAAARHCAFGALVRAAHELTGETDQAKELAKQAAMDITGCKTPEDAYEALFTLNDDPATTARDTLLRLFQARLERG